MKKSRPTVLDIEDTRQLLNGYGLCDIPGSPGVKQPLGDVWIHQCEVLRGLETIVSTYLRQANAPALVARGMSRDSRKKGLGRLAAQTQTDARLHLTFQRGPSTLPSMAELRKKAKDMGVDISAKGIKRREIHDLLENFKGAQIHPDEVHKTPLVDTVLDQLRGKFPMDGV